MKIGGIFQMDKNEFLGGIYKSLGDIEELVADISDEYAADDEINYKLHVIELALAGVQDMIITGLKNQERREKGC